MTQNRRSAPLVPAEKAATTFARTSVSDADVIEHTGIRTRTTRPVDEPGESGVRGLIGDSGVCRSLDVPSDPVIETREVYLDSLQGVDPEVMAVLEAECSSDDPVIEVREVYLDSLVGLDPEMRALLEAECAAADEPCERLQVLVDFEGTNCFFAGLSMDVSGGGLFVTTWQPSPVGTNLMLSVELPDGYTVITPGVVQFLLEECENEDVPPGMGISLLELSARDLAAIRRFCRKRPPTYYDLD